MDSLIDSVRMQLLLDSVVDMAIYMLDPNGAVSSWNAGAERLKGYTAPEVLGQHFSRFYTAEDREAGEPDRTLQSALRLGRFEREGWRVRKDGTRFWARVIIDPIRSESGELVGFAKITRDLSERRTADEALRESEQRFRLLVQGVTDYAIFMLDTDGRVSNWNAGAQRIKGYTEAEILGAHFSQFYTDEDRAAGLPARAIQTAAREGRYEHEGLRVRKDGSTFWASVIIDAIRDEAGKLLGFAKITRDITERREAQLSLDEAKAALFQAQKMEAIGQLTGGIAHDFNNLLTVLVNNLDLLSRTVTTPRERRLIESSQRAADRGSRLTQQLLAFARRQPLQASVHNPNGIISGFEAVLRRACAEGSEFRVELAPDLCSCNIDAPQFEAALLNLVVNSRDAMPEGGRVTISTRNATVPESRYGSNLNPGDYVVITVEDTGFGISQDVLPRVFEPFYTTKDVGKGTGLGLSQVYGFIRQSNGDVRIETELGRGTRVSLYLPAVEPIDANDDADPESAQQRFSFGTVLIVEDEAEVREAAVELFRSLGYDVLTADDAASALEVLARQIPIDILFTDIVMPRGMDGVQLSREVRQRRPEVKILLASGYPMPALKEAGFEKGTSFISKPYRWTELSDKLRSLRNSP